MGVAGRVGSKGGSHGRGSEDWTDLELIKRWMRFLKKFIVGLIRDLIDLQEIIMN